MNSEVRKLRKQVKKLLPYKVYKRIIMMISIFALICIGIGSMGDLMAKEPYIDVPIDEKGYIDVRYMSKSYDNYYFIEDQDYIFIFYYDQELPQDLINVMEYTYGNQDEREVVRLTGIGRYFKSEEELEALLPAFNDFYGVDYTLDEMMEYTGNYYMEYVSHTTHLNSIMTIISEEAFIIGIILVFVDMIMLMIALGYSLMGRNSFKKIIDDQCSDKLNLQLMQPVSYYKAIGVALLKDYLVTNHPVCFAIDFQDITWIYLETRKSFGVVDQEYRLVVCDQNYKRHRLVYCSPIFRRNYQELTILLNSLEQKGNMLVGYTKENKERFKMMKKGL